MKDKPKEYITAMAVLRRLDRPASHLKKLINNVPPDAMVGRTFLYDPEKLHVVEADLMGAEGKAVKL